MIFYITRFILCNLVYCMQCRSEGEQGLLSPQGDGCRPFVWKIPPKVKEYSLKSKTKSPPNILHPLACMYKPLRGRGDKPPLPLGALERGEQQFCEFTGGKFVRYKTNFFSLRHLWLVHCHIEYFVGLVFTWQKLFRSKKFKEFAHSAILMCCTEGVSMLLNLWRHHILTLGGGLSLVRTYLESITHSLLSLVISIDVNVKLFLEPLLLLASSFLLTSFLFLFLGYLDDSSFLNVLDF